MKHFERTSKGINEALGKIKMSYEYLHSVNSVEYGQTRARKRRKGKLGKCTDKKVSVEVEFTEGYQERFTAAIMKIYEKRMRRGEPIRSERDDRSA